MITNHIYLQSILQMRASTSGSGTGAAITPAKRDTKASNQYSTPHVAYKYDSLSAIEKAMVVFEYISIMSTVVLRCARSSELGEVAERGLLFYVLWATLLAFILPYAQAG